MDNDFVPNYYSIDDIFVTQEKVPCYSLQPQRKMGFLVPGSDSQDLLGQQHIDLPLWYCLGIESSRNPTFKFEIPDIYSNVYVDICKADANVVNLGKLNKYYFQFGRYIARFDQTGEVRKSLKQTFNVRMKFLRDQLQNDKIVDLKNDLGLDNLEYQLFKMGSQNVAEFNKWMKGDPCTSLDATDMVKQHRKKLLEENQANDIL